MLTFSIFLLSLQLICFLFASCLTDYPWIDSTTKNLRACFLFIDHVFKKNFYFNPHPAGYALKLFYFSFIFWTIISFQMVWYSNCNFCIIFCIRWVRGSNFSCLSLYIMSIFILINYRELNKPLMSYLDEMFTVQPYNNKW